MMSNKIEKEEFIEILDHGYVVRKGSREIYCCIQSRKSGRCTRSKCRRKQMRNSLRTKRLRGKIKSKKMRKKKKEKETGKGKSPEIKVASIPETEPPHLLSGPEPQSPSQQSASLSDSSTNMIEGEPASFTEPAVGAVDRPRLPTPENEIDTESGCTMDVKRKILWNVNSAYYYRGVLGEEDVGDFPDVRLEPEPTNLSDPNAIKLMFQAIDGEWVHGGYVPKVETQKVRDLEAKGSIISVRVAFWRNRGYWRAPYVQLVYRERIKQVALTNQTLLTPSIVTESEWVGVNSRRYKTHPRRVYGKWLLFVDKKQLDSVWHRVAYDVENGNFGKGCTTAKCSTARETPNCTDSSKGVIVVYTTRSTVDHVGFKLSKLTGIPKIFYKTEAATLAGIYAGDPGCTTKTITYNNGIPRLGKTKANINTHIIANS
jgi:hypothetical protein